MTSVAIVSQRREKSLVSFGRDRFRVFEGLPVKVSVVVQASGAGGSGVVALITKPWMMTWECTRWTSRSALGLGAFVWLRWEVPGRRAAPEGGLAPGGGVSAILGRSPTTAVVVGSLGTRMAWWAYSMSMLARTSKGSPAGVTAATAAAQVLGGSVVVVATPKRL